MATTREELIERLLSLDTDEPLTQKEILELQKSGLWAIWIDAIQQAFVITLNATLPDQRSVENPLIAQNIIDGEETLQTGLTFADVRRECFRALIN